MRTYNVACPLCPVWIEDAITVEHLERALLQHVETEHPPFLGLARAEVAKGLRPRSLFDSVVSDESETTTCVCCGASIVIEPPDPEAPLLQSFVRDHVDRHLYVDVIQEGRS
jgi:hypothetical protein